MIGTFSNDDNELYLSSISNYWWFNSNMKLQLKGKFIDKIEDGIVM